MKSLLQTTIFVCLILSANLANAGETVIQRIGPELNHPWGLAIFNANKVLVTTRPGQLYQIDTSLGSSRLITNTPNVVEHRQGGLLDVAVKKEDETIIVFLCYTKDVGSSKTSTAIYRGSWTVTSYQKVRIFSCPTTHLYAGRTLDAGWL